MLKQRSFSISVLLRALVSRFVCFAFDPKDPDTIAAIEAAVTTATEKLEAKNQQLVTEKRKLQKDATIDPADFAALERERDTLTAQLATANKDLKTAQKAVVDSGAALTGEQTFNQRLLVDAGLNAALLEAGVKNPAHLKAAAALIRSSNKVEVKADGDNRSAVVGDKPLADFVKAWATSEDGKHFVAAPANTGGNANGGPGAVAVNPALAAMKPVDRMHAAREATAAAAAKTT